MALHYPPFSRCAPAAAATAGRVRVIDVGANPIDGDPPYKPLLSAGVCDVLGFEPDSAAYARLLKLQSPSETYVQAAVGDGRDHELRICASSGMNSLLEPDMDLLGRFHGFTNWARVIRRIPVKTVRLDDVAEARGSDLLKIDVQGYELEVFRNAPEVLGDLVAIHTEVEFVPLYKGQPLFAEVDQFLRSRGFMLHRFWPLKSRTVAPMLINGDIYFGLGQVFDADAVYIPAFDRWPGLSSPKLARLAMMIHDLYGSFDVAYAVLTELDRRESSQSAPGYLAALNATPGAARYSLAPSTPR